MDAPIHKNRSIVPLSILILILLAILFLSQASAALAGVGKNNTGFTVQVVSSDRFQVSGGDARLHIDVPDSLNFDDVRIHVNGQELTEQFAPLAGSHTLSGVVDGLEIGHNVVVVTAVPPNRVRPAKLVLKNYPITGPIFSGSHQQPFVCTVQNEGLGQAQVDSATSGFAIFAEDENGDPTEEVIGFSQNCSVEPLVQFVYKATNGSWQPYEPGQERPSDMSQTTTMDGHTVDFIVRWERGTINRFIYSIAMLAPDDSSADDLTTTAWNGKVIYYFQGGVAIGHDQGDPSGSRMLYDYGLSQGYAIIYSTGTKTGTHYNLELGGETALMLKERFIELYDMPIYTVGVGGSGGGIQQYIYGQNHKGLIDAAVPQYSYPDMVTQAVHVGDCELLEFYMDVIDGANPRWHTWPNRTLLEGMNASDTVFNPYTQSLGSTECIAGWRGLSPLAFNPLYGFVDGQEYIYPQADVAAIEWTHFGDLVNIYGVDNDGYARNLWDNVGVQYGLESVASGQITPAEFINVNANIGGWKNEPDIVQEGSPFFPPGVIDLNNWDPWSARNQNLSPDGGLTPAARTSGNLLAMRAAYNHGLVFMGEIDIPIIDWRHYLEGELDMHNSHQSFASRQRMMAGQGYADNQVIWFTDAPNGGQFDQTPEAFQVMDQWMTNILNNPDLSVAENKPALATDRCFDAAGNEIAAGDDVWNGILDDNAPGTCTSQFPVYGTARTVAGGPFKGSIFKCQLKPVSQAIADGDYGTWTPTAVEQAQLEQIFRKGVCDFSQPDMVLGSK